MARYERVALEVAGHKLRLSLPARLYDGGDGRQHVEHMARCIRCGARGRVYDGARVEWSSRRYAGRCSPDRLPVGRRR